MVIIFFYPLTLFNTVLVENQNTSSYFWSMYCVLNVDEAPWLILIMSSISLWFSAIEGCIILWALIAYFIWHDTPDTTNMVMRTRDTSFFEDEIVTALLNGNMLVHPSLVYVVFIILLLHHYCTITWLQVANHVNLCILYTWKNLNEKKQILYKAILVCALGLVLGAWWAGQELNWGGFWVWDPVETVLLLLFLFLVILAHMRHNNLNSCSAHFWYILPGMGLFLNLNQSMTTESLHVFSDLEIEDDIRLVWLKCFFYLFIFIRTIMSCFFVFTRGIQLNALRASLTYYFWAFCVFGFLTILFGDNMTMLLEDLVVILFIFFSFLNFCIETSVIVHFCTRFLYLAFRDKILKKKKKHLC